ncbi:O-antigen ligase family protein [Thermomonas sp. RSS23]|uniref:O-antigen ligase family protein n=1 Tax=Thermomonas beijingensis TaxID=2872701 RepID=A0ABS7TCL4_9GAMM|nr:O-antigen ligase family protein [Thermomonas beijingensis]MBZ4185591.1 O-antigen ligase family protein [Thermomonas beijingensis]
MALNARIHLADGTGASTGYYPYQSYGENWSMMGGVIRSSWLYTFGVFGFVFFGLAVSGIPGWSRLVFAFSGLLALLTFTDLTLNKVRLGRWLLFPSAFLLIAIVGGVARYPASQEAVVRLLGTWSGVLLVVDAVRRGVPIKIIINAMFWASFANAAAVAMGFDAGLAYGDNTNQDAYYVRIIERQSGLVGNANLMAVQAFLPLFATIIWRSEISRLMIAAGGLCAIYAFFITGSRTSIVLVFFLVSALCFRYSHGHRWVLLGAVAVLFFGLLSLVWEMMPSTELGVMARQVVAIDRLFEGIEGTDSSLIVRMNMIEVAKRMFFENPVIGHGLGYFADAGGFGVYAHNNYLELLVSGGALLFAIYYFMYFFVLIRCMLGEIKGNGVRAACVTVFALLAVDYTLVSYDQKSIALMIALLFMTASNRSIGTAAFPEERKYVSHEINEGLT